MVIAHIVCTFPPYNGGMGNVAFEMVKGLQALGHDVRVYTPGYYPDNEIAASEENIPHSDEVFEQIDQVHRIAPKLQYGNAAYLPDILEELRDVDIVHLHYPFYGTAHVIRKWKKRYPEKKLVISYHMDPRATGWKGLFFQLYSKYWMPRIIAMADVVVAASLDYIEHADAALLYKQQPDKWKEIPFGVDTSRFFYQEKSTAICDSLGIDPEKQTLLFVGGMDQAHYFKGIPVLLRALALLKRKELLPQVVLVGDGDLRETYMLQAKGLGMSNEVIFTGRVSDEDLPLVYQAADLFVLPSIHQGEAFGMVLLEAMASGVPVVASDLPGVRTVAKKGGITSVASDPRVLAESILAMLQQDYSSEERQALAIYTKETFSWQQVVDELNQLYTNLVS